MLAFFYPCLYTIHLTLYTIHHYEADTLERIWKAIADVNWYFLCSIPCIIYGRVVDPFFAWHATPMA